MFLIAIVWIGPGANGENSFAIGNARPFNLQERYLDHCPRILSNPNATFDDGKIVAEIQLYSTTLKLQSNSARMRFADYEYEEIEHWKMEWAHLLSKSSPPGPLPGTSPVY